MTLGKFPIPCGYRIIVELRKIEEKSKGGVILVDTHKDAERHLAMIAKVVALGPEAYKDSPARSFHAPWCKVGDWVMFSKYAGSRMMIEGTEYRSINDDEVQCVIPEGLDPSSIKAAS